MKDSLAMIDIIAMSFTITSVKIEVISIIKQRKEKETAYSTPDSWASWRNHQVPMVHWYNGTLVQIDIATFKK